MLFNVNHIEHKSNKKLLLLSFISRTLLIFGNKQYTLRLIGNILDKENAIFFLINIYLWHIQFQYKCSNGAVVLLIFQSYQKLGYLTLVHIFISKTLLDCLFLWTVSSYFNECSHAIRLLLILTYFKFLVRS